MMAERLRKKDIDIDAFIASPAKRARKTAEAFVKELKDKKKEIEFYEELYLAGPSVFFDVISKINDKHDTIAVFSHNDGITAFANLLTTTRIDNIPTCGIFAVKAKIKHWSEFETAEKEFWFFDYPKAGED